MLILTRKPGQAIVIGDDVKVVYMGEDKVKNQARIGIMAPDNVSVHRQEIYDKIVAENNLIEKNKTKNEIGTKINYIHKKIK